LRVSIHRSQGKKKFNKKKEKKGGEKNHQIAIVVSFQQVAIGRRINKHFCAFISSL
jgi:hypothetical protein